MKINVDSGKYTFVADPKRLDVEILRHGEPWHEQVQASNALRSIMAELDAARVVLEAARNVTDVARGDARAMNAALDTICDALAKHDRLVHDFQPPSEWTQ